MISVQFRFQDLRAIEVGLVIPVDILCPAGIYRDLVIWNGGSWFPVSSPFPVFMSRVVFDICH